MLTIPIPLNHSEMNLIIVFEDENLDRLKLYDPAEVPLSKMGPYGALKIRSIGIMYATQEESAKVVELIRQDKLQEALQLLSRGFKYRPEMGDGHPYVSLLGVAGEVKS